MVAEIAAAVRSVEQVQDYAPDFIRAVEQESCFVRGRTQIVAIGHSLGGGLAQQAAFMDGKIRRVFAFDPSFVTGYYDPHVIPVRDKNVQGLLIERIYEHGEILAYPRFALRQLVPPSACNPQIRTIQFNTLRGTGIRQHNLSAMTTALLSWSRRVPPAAKRTDLPRPKPGIARPVAKRVLWRQRVRGPLSNPLPEDDDVMSGLAFFAPGAQASGNRQRPPDDCAGSRAPLTRGGLDRAGCGRSRLAGSGPRVAAAGRTSAPGSINLLETASGATQGAASTPTSREPFSSSRQCYPQRQQRTHHRSRETPVRKVAFRHP